MVISALAIKETITIKSQNRVDMVQTYKEMTTWHYGYNFRLVLELYELGQTWMPLDILKTMSAGSL